MMCFRQYITSLSFIVLAINLPAQNLTGTWEGDLGTEQSLQLNIIQTGNKICGYTRDYVKANQRSFCKAFFEGSYDRNNLVLFIDGKYFIETSKNHQLMTLNLKYKRDKKGERLEVPPVERVYYRERITASGRLVIEPYVDYDYTDYILLKKVSDQPSEINELMRDCISQDRAKDPVVTFSNPPQKDSIKLPPPILKKDSAIPPPVVFKKDSVSALPKTITQRKNTEQSRITVNTKTINLKVYDNAIMDGDTVSILYNGRLLLSHQLLSEKGIEINLELNDKQSRHELVLFAENLGSIPPNTALIVITAGEKRYELFASASLEENAVLVFEYKPK